MNCARSAAPLSSRMVSSARKHPGYNCKRGEYQMIPINLGALCRQPPCHSHNFQAFMTTSSKLATGKTIYMVKCGWAGCQAQFNKVMNYFWGWRLERTFVSGFHRKIRAKWDSLTFPWANPYSRSCLSLILKDILSIKEFGQAVYLFQQNVSLWTIYHPVIVSEWNNVYIIRGS